VELFDVSWKLDCRDSAIGAAMLEEVLVDDRGRVTTPNFRTYRLPAFADIPRTEVLFAKTRDQLGPYVAKSMSEPVQSGRHRARQRHPRRHRRSCRVRSSP
jgi:hypothetical protein